MGDHKKGGKRAVPRHRKQVASSADRQERSIERTFRQTAQKQIKELVLEEEPEPEGFQFGEYWCWKDEES